MSKVDRMHMSAKNDLPTAADISTYAPNIRQNARQA